MKQPADQLELGHASPSAGDTLANVVAGEESHDGPGSHAVLGSPRAEQNLPPDTDILDRGVPAVQSGGEAAPVDSSAAVYQPASPTHEETVSHEQRAASEEQGPGEQGPEMQGSEEDVQQQQPGLSAQSATYCMACLSLVHVDVIGTSRASSAVSAVV